MTRTVIIALVTIATIAPFASAQTKPDEADKELAALRAEVKLLREQVVQMDQKIKELAAMRSNVEDMDARMAEVGDVLTRLGAALAGGAPLPPVARVDSPSTTVRTPGTTPRPTINIPPKRVTEPTPSTIRTPTPDQPLPRRTVDLFPEENLVGGTGGGIVAAVDVVKVFNSLLETAEAEADFQIRKERLADEARTRAEKIRNMQLDLGVLAKGTPAYDKLKTQLEDEVQKWHIWRNVERNEMGKARAERMQTIYDRVIAAVGNVATGNGYDVVVYKETRDSTNLENYQNFAQMALGRKVLYTTNEEDLTELVVRQMNAEHTQLSAK